jgi:predicted RNA-binding Zn-ribbon protein involved in translation (DUF1610 family)
MGRKYAANFGKRTEERKKAVGFRCEQCGAAERSIAVSKTGSPYMVYLAGSHVHHDPWNPEAELQVLCQSCHLKYDAQHHAEVRRQNAEKAKAKAEARKKRKQA